MKAEALSKFMKRHNICYYETPADAHFLEIGRGWYGLVMRCMRALLRAGWDGSFHQIKEKFGSLRFYFGGTDEQYEILSRYVHLSARVCDACGSRRNVSRESHRGWIFTLCTTCRTKLGPNDDDDA